MKTPSRIALAVALLSLLVLPAAEARGKKAGPTAPGTYVDWQGEIDELVVVEGFALSGYGKVLVEPFETDDVPLPDQDDNSYQPVVTVLAHAAVPFTASLADEMKGRVAVAAKDKNAEVGAGTLILRNRVNTMDPGSQAARYWAGFGAGAARTEVSGELVDAATGKVLLRYRQERRSGAGAFGGGYEKLLDRNLETLGEDVAMILKAF